MRLFRPGDEALHVPSGKRVTVENYMRRMFPPNQYLVRDEDGETHLVNDDTLAELDIGERGEE